MRLHFLEGKGTRTAVKLPEDNILLFWPVRAFSFLTPFQCGHYTLWIQGVLTFKREENLSTCLSVKKERQSVLQEGCIVHLHLRSKHLDFFELLQVWAMKLFPSCSCVELRLLPAPSRTETAEKGKSSCLLFNSCRLPSCISAQLNCSSFVFLAFCNLFTYSKNTNNIYEMSPGCFQMDNLHFWFKERNMQLWPLLFSEHNTTGKPSNKARLHVALISNWLQKTEEILKIGLFFNGN